MNLINGLPNGDYQHAVLCLTYAIAFRHRIVRADVRVFEVHKRPGKDFGAYRRVWRTLRELRPDVLHTRNRPTVDMLPVAALAGVR